MRKVYLIFTFVLLIGVLAGCGQDGSAVEITVVSPFDASDGNRNNFVGALEAFESSTEFSVIDVSEKSSEEWKAKVRDEFQSGKDPDVLFYFTGADADKLVEGDKFVSLSDIRKSYPDYASNMKDSMMPVSTFDGRQYAVPVNGYWEGMFVNKKVLEACGVDVPGADYTWDRFLEDCRIIKNNGYTPISCSLMEVPHYWFEYAVFNNGSITNHVKLPQNSGDAIGQKWAAGLLDIKYLYENGFFPENTTTISYDDACLLMVDNEAAFMIDGSWKVGWFLENAANIDDFAVTYVPAKGERAATEIVGGLSMGYYITKKAWDDPKKSPACVAFVEAMTTDEVVSAFAALSVTALKNGTTPMENADSLAVSALAMTKNCTGIVPAAQDNLNASARSAFFEDFGNIVTGRTTPEEAIDKCLSIKE